MVGRVGLEPTCFRVSGLQPPAVAAVPPADVSGRGGEIRTPDFPVPGRMLWPS